jgi:hypothetical protein
VEASIRIIILVGYPQRDPPPQAGEGEEKHFLSAIRRLLIAPLPSRLNVNPG